MVHHSNLYSWYADRSMLARWFPQDILVITDADIVYGADLKQLISQHHCTDVVVDLSHNPFPEEGMPGYHMPEHLTHYPCLSGLYHNWYQSTYPNRYFFPIWLYMLSLRGVPWFDRAQYDAHGRKTESIMCLNRNIKAHRTEFRNMIAPILDRITWSWADRPLPNSGVDANGLCKIDIAVGHPVYGQCAVNIVTETSIDLPYLSEKSCKPFIARQIPVIVGPVLANQFLSDIGLDMFQDLVPWTTWDREQNSIQRLRAIADFVIDWLDSGTILDDYQSVIPRIERNKQYFHSDKFRDVLLRHMPQIDQFKL